MLLLGKRLVLGDRRWDLVALASFLLFAFVLTLPLWRDLDHAVPEANQNDHAQFEFVLARAAKLVSGGGGDWLLTGDMNAPLGVNMMANTAVLGLGIPLAPVTLLAGPAATFALLVLLGMALTAYGWYWVFSRRLVESRLAAAIGGAFCGFAPGVVTHTQGHPNWVALFLLPFVVHLLFAPASNRYAGVLLGLIMSYQVFINEESLFFTGLGSAIFGTLYALLRWNEVDKARFFTNLGIAAAITGVVAAYPLWVQFTGPGSYHGVPEFTTSYGNDLASFFSFSTHSLGGSFSPFGNIAANRTEENAFFGVPLVILFLALAVIFRKRPVALAASCTAVVFAVLSIGRDIIINGYGDVTAPGPWEPFAHLPLFDSVVPTRLVLVAIPCVGLLLALAVERSRTVLLPLVLAALLPIVPLPMDTKQIPPIPAYITGHEYRAQLTDGGSMLVVPGPWTDTTNLRWAARSGLEFPLALGYFIGPGPEEDGRGIFGPQKRPTHLLIADVTATGVTPVPTAEQRAAFAADLAFWQTSVIVVPAEHQNREAVKMLLADLTGRPPTEIGGVTVWDIAR
ncbi:hypothetical protein ACIA8K_40520 [Catenuloplanes sp. NPDC051500]|uniref:hypothetical protein n=1 Tax=Catenuloplanes sp. NPDC051500 TaxID=3363959 RepID=UPI003793ECC8